MRILTDTAHTGRTSTIARYPGTRCDCAMAVQRDGPLAHKKAQRELSLYAMLISAQNHHAPSASYALIDDGERRIYKIDIAEHEPRVPQRIRLGNSSFF